MSGIFFVCRYLLCMYELECFKIYIYIYIYLFLFLFIYLSIDLCRSFFFKFCIYIYISLSLSRSPSLHISSFACLFVFQVIPFALWHQYKQQVPVRCTICFSKKQKNGKVSRYNKYVKDPSFYRHVQPAVSFNGFFLRGSVLGTFVVRRLFC